MMRIAILGDIHANIHALEAVLEDLQRQAADRVIINGDLVNRGPNNLRVMERLVGEEFDYTLGNHDDLVRMWIDHDEKIPREWYADPFWRGTALCAEALQAAGWIDTLRGLPMVQEIAIEGAPRVLVSHGSPRHYREGYAGYAPDENLMEVASLFPAELYIGSHTHRPFQRRIGSHLFLNTGAVGAPFNRNPAAQYLLLTLRDGRWEYVFRSVPYDVAAALAAFEASGYLQNGGLSTLIFREELRLACPLFDPFWRWTKENELATDWPAWEIFRAKFPERFRELGA